MILRSNPDSVRLQQVSALAVAETALATVAAIALYHYFGWLSHIAISAMLAPFLLMQTPISTAWNLAAATLIHDFIRSRRARETNPQTTWQFVSATIYLAVLLFVRIFITILMFMISKGVIFVASLATHPIKSIGAIPENWRKIALCTDAATPPELIPGINALPTSDVRSSLEFFSVKSAIARMSGVTHWVGKLVVTVILVVTIVPGLIYRFSLKSTALIWSPLVWAFKPIRLPDKPETVSSEIVELSVNKFARAYSLLALFLFFVKIFIWFFWGQIAAVAVNLPGWHVLGNYIAPSSFPLWQIAAAFNAVASWWMYFRAERYLLRVRRGAQVSNTSTISFFKTIFVIRNVLSIYIILCTLYISAKLAMLIDFQVLNFVVFPW